VILMNIRSIPQRLWMSLATVVSIALVVAVLLGFLALANCFSQTLKGSGSSDVAIVLRDGSQSEINSTLTREQIVLLGQGPGVRAAADGGPLVSAELLLIVDGIGRSPLGGPLGRRGLPGSPELDPFPRCHAFSRLFFVVEFCFSSALLIARAVRW
jgi:hypothetical protein